MIEPVMVWQAADRPRPTPETSVKLEPIVVNTASHDSTGLLVMFDGRLVGVLVQISSRSEDVELAGHWYLEAGFGQFDGPDHPTFASLWEATAWFNDRLAPTAGKGRPETPVTEAATCGRSP